jgi:hypothetical protein
MELWDGRVLRQSAAGLVSTPACDFPRQGHFHCKKMHFQKIKHAEITFRKYPTRPGGNTQKWQRHDNIIKQHRNKPNTYMEHGAAVRRNLIGRRKHMHAKTLGVG